MVTSLLLKRVTEATLAKHAELSSCVQQQESVARIEPSTDTWRISLRHPRFVAAGGFRVCHICALSLPLRSAGAVVGPPYYSVRGPAHRRLVGCGSPVGRQAVPGLLLFTSCRGQHATKAGIVACCSCCHR